MDLFTMNKQKLLHDLLIKLFVSTQDLRTFVYMNVHEIHTSVVGENASISNLAFSVTDLLFRRGYVDERLFDSLIDQFPENIEEIEDVEAQIL